VSRSWASPLPQLRQALLNLQQVVTWLALASQILLSEGLVEKAKCSGVSQNGPSPSSCWKHKHKSFSSTIHCVNLVGLLQVRLTKVWGPLRLSFPEAFLPQTGPG
jgi:hypothetical protein